MSQGITDLEADALSAMGVPSLDFVPSNEKELAWCLGSPEWRLSSGQLYKVLVKSSTEGEDSVVPFRPKAAQRRLMRSLWYRNIILKARQLGFTTLTCILWLDHALFLPNQRCGVIAQDLDAAKGIFKDKVRFVYDNLPSEVRAMFPLSNASADELAFKHNNSSFRVAVSMRSGTLHRLLVSEFGKICAKYPEKAEEVVTGSLPSVPLDGIAVIESTAEGQDGDFYQMTQRAIQLNEEGAELTLRDYRFHFYAWWAEPDYVLPQAEGRVVISTNDEKYFDRLEVDTGQTITVEQRRWYVATRDSEFNGDQERMWREYPSTPVEAFQVSTEGKWFAEQMTALRKRKGIMAVPLVEGIPVNTFWDIGNSDGTAVWLHQRVGLQDRFIKFIEGWGEPYSYYTKQLIDMGHLWGDHYLPHDAGHKRQQFNVVSSPEDELKKASLGGRWIIVPRVEDIVHGIQLTRNVFSQCVFDAEGCKEGIIHLDGYSKVWNLRQACWSSTPNKADGHSEAADSFRQFAQSQHTLLMRSGGGIGLTQREKRPRGERSWKTA